MRYNKNTEVLEVENHQGGTGVKLDPKFELIGILATGFNDNFYESLGQRETRFVELIKQLAKKDIEFLAKALVYTRTVTGQRSVTHFGATHLAKFLSGNPIAKRFFTKRDRKENSGGIIYRLDDILEIIACYQHFNPEKPLPAAMKRGFKLALETADKYELAKYQGKGKKVSLVDVVNLVHPKPSKGMESTFKLLMTGELKQFNTVEDKNTSAGKEVASKLKAGELTQAEAAVELQEAKEDNYRELIESGKIGYLALIRNLRNILNNTKDSKLVDSACGLLTDQKLVRKSLVFPHQIDLALEILLLEVPTSANRNKIVKALDQAYELAIPNLTELFPFGRTAIVFDTSASMTSYKCQVNGKTIEKAPIEKAALIAATLAKGIAADVYHFASGCVSLNYNPNDSVNTLKQGFMNHIGEIGHGTEFGSIFNTLMQNGKYDRVFVISDMQGGDSIMHQSPYQSYCKKYGLPYIYSLNPVGYSTTMFKPTNKLIQLFGYSADIYEYIKRAEIDPKAILKEIEKIKI